MRVEGSRFVGRRASYHVTKRSCYLQNNHRDYRILPGSNLGFASPRCRDKASLTLHDRFSSSLSFFILLRLSCRNLTYLFKPTCRSALEVLHVSGFCKGS